MWQHRTCANASDLDNLTPTVTPAEAQAWCNFIVWIPERLPAECQLLSGTLRREAPPGMPVEPIEDRGPRDGNYLSSYRFEIAGTDRTLRIKQFYYDWAFPAFDQPCLWKSHTHAVPIDDTHVVWFGVDFLGNQAASARLGRTTIELSVLEGTFTELELLGLYQALHPVDAGVVKAIAATSHAQLSYWARHADAAQLVVPIGFWTFRRGAHQANWSSTGWVADQGFPVALAGLDLDSAAHIQLDDNRAEIEVIYDGGRDRGVELRLIAQRPGKGGLRIPADPEPHPGQREQIRHGGLDIQLGWIDERYGPFQAVFTTPDQEWEATLLSSAGVGLGRAWFLAALDELTR
ncbi:hypothetical protein OHB12_28890 [Nocardia sp. NBC_01730]|uniref:hypothetical protein n=1 Tax=Nocardia sp. NBC_01730 TaxID=2975998 RepID=UPI002E0E170F|nr:hypothetical protein OHB12_28890 [Nocardia sp. NBC_01730]